MLRGSVAHTTLHRFYAGLPRAIGSDRVVEARAGRRARRSSASAWKARSRACKMEMTELERRELEQSLRRDLEQLVRDEARSPVPLLPRKFEVGFGSERSAPELQRGLDLGDGITLSGKIDRIDVDPGSARGIVQDYKSGRTGHSAARDREGAAAPDPALHARAARSRRDRAARRALPAAGGRAPAARAAARRGEGATCFPASPRTTTSTRTRSGRRSRARATSHAGWPSGSARATCGTTRRGRTVVRPGATSGGCAGSGGHERRGPQRAAGGGDRGARTGLRLGRRRHRQDDGARRALRRGGLRAGHRRRVDARDHLHGARRGRAAAAGSARACTSSDATTWRARSTAPGSRPSTASACGC